MDRLIKMMFGIFMVLSFTACSEDFFENPEPMEVTVDGVTWRRDFFDEILVMKDINMQEEIYIVEEKEYRRVDFDGFDLLRCLNEGGISYTYYCAEDQWDQAKAYYEDRDNYLYYCQLGAENIYKDPLIMEIPDMDSEKLDQLMDFVKENRYRPFGGTNPNLREIPFPDQSESPAIFFYKESVDGLFTTHVGKTFYMDEGQLVLLYRYDHGRGEDKKMQVVDVEEDLSVYFVDIVAKFMAAP